MGGRLWTALLTQQSAILSDFKLPKLSARLKTRVMLCSQLPVGLAGFFTHSAPTAAIFWPRSGFGWSIDRLLTLRVALSGETQTTSAACFTSCLSHAVAAFAWRVEGKSFSPEWTVNTTSYFYQAKLDKISIRLRQVTGNSVQSPSAFRNRFTLPQAKPAMLRLLWSERLTEWLTVFFIEMKSKGGFSFIFHFRGLHFGCFTGRAVSCEPHMIWVHPSCGEVIQSCERKPATRPKPSGDFSWWLP